ncbi:DNA damage-induced apoptosis suppressor protein isoform X2 [Pygocentrus nattereri]|uniref:DNA damage-induced apoptosis suppressor protein isoform X2 n=1 Tax=Pygocentrus nattereri TaxID=42514 RepID=UPI0008146166|nr:DNA damage-induced apoptosis suppressor protein isoform X2 [Pygocentrus nattereri]
MGSEKVLVSCTVISLQDTRFVYPCCKFCLSRSTEESDLRFVESEKPEGPQSLQQLLTKAVEDCFIGKSFVFGFKLSGLDTEGCLLSDSVGSSAESAQFVACQIISPNGAFLGMTVFAYLQSLLQANSHPSCSASNKAICQSQQVDSLVNSFEYTLPLCVTDSEASSGGLTRLWQPTSEMDSCFSPENPKGHNLQQISVGDVRGISSQYVHTPWPELEPGWPTKEFLLSQSQEACVKSTRNTRYAESRGGAHTRHSSLCEFSSTSFPVANKLDSPVALTSSVAHESLGPVNTTSCGHQPKVFNHWSSGELADTQCNASNFEKSLFSHYLSFGLEDAPLSESLGSFVSIVPQTSKAVNVNILRPASRCITQRQQTTPKKTNDIFTPLHNITSVIANRNERSLKKMLRKRKILSLSKPCLPGTPKVSQGPEGCDIKDTVLNSLTKSPVNMAFRLQCYQRDKNVTQVNNVVCPKIQSQGMKEQESQSHQDAYNCSADLFYQSSADMTIQDVTNKAVSDLKEIKKDWLLNVNISEHEVFTSFNFAPSLQSTPIAHSYYRHSDGQRHTLSRKCSATPCTKKTKTHTTSMRVLGNYNNTSQESKTVIPEFNRIQSSDFVSENSDFRHSSGASEVQGDEEHDSALPTNTNEWSRDLFSNSF